MPILPLPQFETDLEEDRKIYERLKPPTSVVVRFGAMKLVGEFPYSEGVKPGCGTKFVVRTHRGTEIGEMLTSTCPNAGCSKSVTRKEMLEYIENSGGRDYPFFNQGKVDRIATVEDLNEQSRLDAQKPQMIRTARAAAERLGLPVKIVDAEPILGQERLTFHFTSEQRVDFRELVGELARLNHARIEMHQVGARDEARLTADYERCGQHCCCKQFLKVLKPVSMKQAKIQKATLDPLKISGRCGRLMCCLRYEEQTYDELRARLPRKKSRVQTPDGWGTVLDTQILTQLALVQLDATGEQVAVAIEDFITGGTPPPPPPPQQFQPGGTRSAVPPSRTGPDRPPPRPPGPGTAPQRRDGALDEPPTGQSDHGDDADDEPRSSQPPRTDPHERPQEPPRQSQPPAPAREPRPDEPPFPDGQRHGRRRRRGRGPQARGLPPNHPNPPLARPSTGTDPGDTRPPIGPTGAAPGDSSSPGGGGPPREGRRRRRRRRGRGGGGGGDGQGPGGPPAQGP